jgi:hypothetical protein
MRDAGPMREALMRRLAETERRLAALERRAVPGASPDPFDAAAHEAWWFKANTGNVLATTSGVPLNVAWATSHVFNAEGFTPRLSSAADWVLPAGVWWFEAWVRFDASAVGKRQVFPLVDGTSSGRRTITNPVTVAAVQTEAQSGALVVSDGSTRVGVQLTQTSGGALTCEARISAVRVGTRPAL